MMAESGLQVHVVDHPLVRQHLTQLRRRETPADAFRRHVRVLATLLTYDATLDLDEEPIDITTPMAPMVGSALASRVGLIPILRAGLGMVEPILDLLPQAEVWHLGLYRDEATARPVHYYSMLPVDQPVDVALVVDPMLATGGSALAALTSLREWGVPTVKLLAIIASRAGIEAVTKEFPSVPIHVCAVDADLDERKFIVPGLGDAGDRTFGT